MNKSLFFQWRVGDRCLAPYYDDQLWYPAVIKRLDFASGKCEVLYDVYNELASVNISDLTKYINFYS
ncbi:unnamed protein product [Gongylonema pulchrum]|uniref:Tudor domain-containing protein n=1 Tax=Gongylonema pulchrum TaxID=637853 RepID=A0A3P7RVT0_9BILA|nr:unnamed protein product [Gongylonema pulchrum]